MQRTSNSLDGLAGSVPSVDRLAREMERDAAEVRRLLRHGRPLAALRKLHELRRYTEMAIGAMPSLDELEGGGRG